VAHTGRYASVRPLRSIITWGGVFVVAITIFSALGTTQTTYAAMSDNSRLRYGDARRYCDELPGYGYHGMLWLSNQSDYYSEQVVIGENDQSVGLSLRGAVNSCEVSDGYATYAIDVAVQSGPVTLDGSSFYRGNTPGGQYKWSTEGHRLGATINVAGVAVCTGSGNVSQSVQVDIYRRLRLNNTALGSGVEKIDLTVQRNCPVAQWSINGQSYIKNTQSDTSADARLPVGLSQGTVKARVGDRLNWYHDLRNNGPNNMLNNLTYVISLNGFTQPGWQGRPVVATGKGNVNELFVRHYARYSDSSIDRNQSAYYTLYDVQGFDIGKTLCQNIVWAPKSWNDASEGGSGQACAAVPYEYALTPTVKGVNDGDTTEPDRQAVTVEGNVTNGRNRFGEGPTKTVNNVRWQLTEVVFDPSVPIPQITGGFSASGINPCTFITGEKPGSCKVLASGTEANGFSSSTSPVSLATSAGSSGTYAVGTRICYLTSVDNWEATYNLGARAQSIDTQWRHSAMSCLVVAKKPKVQVQGGDLFVGRQLPGTSVSGSNAEVTTSLSTIGSGMVYGSWGEYGVASTGRVTGMASASTLAGGVPTSNAGICNNSLLTFNNVVLNGAGTPVCNTSNVGKYSFNSSLPSVASRFPLGSATTLTGTSANVTALANSSGGSKVYTTSATSFNLASAGTVNLGRWLVINAPDTDITISSNIGYSSASMTSVSQIPQVIIIAKNITITSNVTRVDAWLVATGKKSGASVTDGTVYTCDVARADLKSTVCNNKLTVNGPVMARKLQLLRTAGAGRGDASGDPAEVFNLRPDAYLWAMNRGGGQNKITTVDTTELPPRY
jgi:hypothetical protein